MSSMSKARQNHAPSCAWITGASRGIGRELALQYASRGISLILSSPNTEGGELEKLARLCEEAGAPSARVVPLDYKDTAACVGIARTIAPEIQSAVLCAGVSQRALAADTLPETLTLLFTINAITPSAISAALAKAWQREKTEGHVAGGHAEGRTPARHIAVVSSIAAYSAVPLRSSYCAAKAALEKHAATLANETYRENIRVTRVIPGFVRTDISRTALTEDGSAWNRMDENQRGAMDPKIAARRIARGLLAARPPRSMFVGMTKKLWLMYFLTKHAEGLAYFILQRVKTT